MIFCPECSNIFDIGKISIVESDNNNKIIKKTIDLFKLIDNNEDLTNYKASFPLKEILENKKYIKYWC